MIIAALLEFPEQMLGVCPIVRFTVMVGAKCNHIVDEICAAGSQGYDVMCFEIDTAVFQHEARLAAMFASTVGTKERVKCRQSSSPLGG